MWLGWLMIALVVASLPVAQLYDTRRKQRIAQLAPGTLYRPVNGWYFVWGFLAILAWNFGMHRIGASRRWVLLGLLVFTVFLVARRWRARRSSRHQPAE